jgi:hypothetical protein
MSAKRSQQQLKRLVEKAVAEVCCLPRPGLWFCVDAVEVQGRPPARLTVWATLHFLPEGSPFCCGEPGCHLGLFGERLTQIADHLRRAMHLRQPLLVEFGDGVAANYHAGINFREADVSAVDEKQ